MTLRTLDDARHYMAALPDGRSKWKQWQIAARLLLEDADPAQITRVIELADVRGAAGFTVHVGLTTVVLVLPIVGAACSPIEPSA